MLCASLTCSKNFDVFGPLQYVDEVELGKSGMASGQSTDRLDAIDHLFCQLDAVDFTVSALAKAIITGRFFVFEALFSAEVFSKVLKLQRSPTINLVVAECCHSEHVVFTGFHYFMVYSWVGYNKHDSIEKQQVALYHSKIKLFDVQFVYNM